MPPSKQKKLAVFDMDETLIHCLGTRKFTDNSKKVNEDGIELSADNADVVTRGMSMNG